MHVRFCVVPSAQAEEIAEIGREFAAMDPNARRVVLPVDADYPKETIAAAIAGHADAGAVMLTPKGTVFEVMNVDDARNGGMVDVAFARARLA